MKLTKHLCQNMVRSVAYYKIEEFLTKKVRHQTLYLCFTCVKIWSDLSPMLEISALSFISKIKDMVRSVAYLGSRDLQTH